MEWCKTERGTDIIVFGEGSYISFGKDPSIKWIHLSYVDGTGVRHGQLLPVTLNKVKKEYSAVIGKKNLTKLRDLIRDRLEGDKLSRQKFYEIGECINLERREKEKKGK